MLVNILMVAEMVEFAFSARIRNAFGHYYCCRDGGIYVSSADPQCFVHSDGSRDGGTCVSRMDPRFGGFAFRFLQRWLFFCQRRALFGILTVAEMAEYSIPARIRQYLWHADGCRDGGICVFSVDPQSLCFLHSDGCIDGGICAFSADP